MNENLKDFTLLATSSASYSI